MAASLTLKSALATAIAAGGISNWQLPGLIDGRVKVLLDTYTATGSNEDAGSVVTFKALPTGANILAVFIFSDNSTAGLTVSVGDADSATRYGSALTSLQAAGMYMLAASGALPRVVGTSTNDKSITFTTDGSALTTSKIYGLMVLYSFY